ncbi:MAG: hypothetical protein ACI4TM_01950 [Candidatus Cryptobacteroides sp.]
MKSHTTVRHIFITFIILIFPSLCKAQFYVTGDDPGKLRWNTVETDNYKIIYPVGNDSLAHLYARNLEKYRMSISRTTGYPAKGNWNSKMPVVLHTHYGENGSVAWAPSRMDLFTIPNPYSPEPLPWHKMLAIHESRHVTQMQFGMTKSLRPFNWFFGEMINIAASLLYPGISNMEGDAVIVETAYSQSGRGRTADFLNYYRVAFDSGIERNWFKWRYGSQRFYVPNYYALGYITVGGTRVLYDCPDYMYRVYDLAARRPYRFDANFAVLKQVSGKGIKPAFKEICDSLTLVWKSEADARAPYIDVNPVSKEQRLHTNYSNPVFTEDGIFTVKSGFLNSPALIKIDSDGKEKFVKHMSSNISNINYDRENHRLWWSESTSGVRWSLKSRSLIYSMDTQSGRTRTYHGRYLLHNPEASPDGKMVATAHYDPSGTTAITLMDAQKGDWRRTLQAPDSLQVVQIVWKEDGNLYASSVSEGGYGIFRINPDKGEWENVLPPQPVMLTDLNDCPEGLSFTSDMDGENELYVFDLQSKTLVRKSRSRFGLQDYSFSPDRSKVVFSKPTVKGHALVSTHADSLRNDTLSFGPHHRYHLAERLTAQEKAFAASKGEEYISSSDSISISQPKRYRKAAHLFNVHSWAPFYVSVDNIMNMSGDYMFQTIALGASGIMQNRLATMVGEFGYSAHKEPYNRSRWRHSGHAKLTYSGLLPVFEASIDFNDRAARLYTNHAWTKGNSASIGMSSSELPIPSLQGKISAYVPLSFNSGGWYRGFIPKLTYSINNDCFDNTMLVRSYDVVPGGSPVRKVIYGKRTKTMQSLMGSLRLYGTLAVPNSAVYPRWGGGVELGVYGSLSYGKYVSPMGYGYAYGYFPGVVRAQGLKLTALYQQKLSGSHYFGMAVTNTIPRGFEDVASLPSWGANASGWALKFTADYAIPIYAGEWPIFDSFIYVKRMVLTPHFDCSLFNGFSLYSAGASLTFSLQTLVWIEWPCSVGVTASVNGSLNGTFDAVRNASGLNLSRWFVGPVFNVSF